MVESRTLANPPIREAILAVRFRPQLSTPIIENVPDEIVSNFTGKRRTRRELRAEFRLEDVDNSGMTAQRVAGELFNSEDGTRTAFVGRDAFSLSALSGAYTGWEEFEDEYRKLWRLFCEKNRPNVIWRVSTRFINEIFLPFEQALDFDDYLVFGPNTPTDLPDQVISFTNRVIIPVEQVVATVTLQSDGSQDSDRLRVMLDVDVWQEVEMPCGDDGLWELFQNLRSIKNKAFFGSLTEKSMELFS